MAPAVTHNARAPAKDRCVFLSRFSDTDDPIKCNKVAVKAVVLRADALSVVVPLCKQHLAIHNRRQAEVRISARKNGEVTPCQNLPNHH